MHKQIDPQAQAIVNNSQFQSALNMLFNGQLISAEYKPSISGSCMKLVLDGFHWFTDFGDVEYMIDDILYNLNPNVEITMYPRETSIEYEQERTGFMQVQHTGNIIVNLYFRVD